MQAIQAFQCLYFHPKRAVAQTLADILSQRRRHKSLYRREPIEVRNDSDEPRGQIVAVPGADLKLGGKLNFVRIRDQRRLVTSPGSR